MTNEPSMYRNYNSIEAEVAADLNTSKGGVPETAEGNDSNEDPEEQNLPPNEDPDNLRVEEDQGGHGRRRRRRNGNVVHDDEDGVNGIVTIEAVAAAVVEDARSEDSSIVDFADADLMADADLEKDVFRTKTSITVSDLARKSPRVLGWNHQSSG